MTFLRVQQGYSIGGTVTTESSSGSTFETSKEKGQTNTHNTVDVSMNDLGGEFSSSVSIFGAAEESITVSYNHQFGTEKENGGETSSGSSSTTGTENSYTSGTEAMTQQDFTTSVTVTLAPPQGYVCYIDVSIYTCRGVVNVNSPITL